MIIELDRSNPLPLYQQIVAQIGGMIRAGSLPAGYRLPPERRLAEELHVNRTTILNAYRELKAQGLITSHVGQGTVVLPLPVQDSGVLRHSANEPVWELVFSKFSSRFDAYVASDFMKLMNREDMLSFANGIADPALAPLEALRGAELFHPATLRSPVEGLIGLREQLSLHMRSMGTNVQPEEIMVLSGSQQGTDLVSRMLIDPGDVVVVEDPSYFPALQVFRSLGARILGVPVDGNGLCVDVLEELLQRYRPKLACVNPNFQNPTGTVLSLERRRRLLELAHRFRFLLLEGDAYGALRYAGEQLPTLKSMDSSGYVIYLSTFSKTIYPGLRIGWIAAHRKLIRRFALTRQVLDTHTNCLSQGAIEHFLRGGFWAPHLSKVKAEYAMRMELMRKALDAYATQGFHYALPQGGYHIWCRLPEGLPTSQLLTRCAEKNVIFLPGHLFFLSDGQEEYMRLNFTYAPKQRIAEGISLIMETARELLAEGGRNQARTRGTMPLN